MADAADSKSAVGKPLVGSSPTSGTISTRRVAPRRHRAQRAGEVALVFARARAAMPRMRPPVVLPYIWFVPGFWLVTSLLCYFLTASEQRALWMFAAFAGSWIAMVMKEGFSSPESSVLWVTLVGAGCMALLGLALRRLRYPRPRLLRTFVLLSAVAILGLTFQFGGFSAWEQGGFWRYLVAGLCAGFTGAVVWAAVTGPILTGRGALHDALR